MSGDFVRRLPGGATSFRNHRGAFTWFNLDPWLMLILLSIVSFGLVVLHSASDGNWVVVEAQLVRLGLGFGLMVLIAQIPPYFLLRTAPLLYAQIHGSPQLPYKGQYEHVSGMQPTTQCHRSHMSPIVGCQDTLSSGAVMEMASALRE